MKRMMLCLLLLVLVVSCFACGGETEPVPTIMPTEGASPMPEETILPTVAPTVAPTAGTTTVPT